MFVLVTFRPHRPLSTFDKIALRQTGSKDGTSSAESIRYPMIENKGNETYMKKTEGKSIKVDKSMQNSWREDPEQKTSSDIFGSLPNVEPGKRERESVKGKWVSEAYLEDSQASTMELFCENS